MLKQILVRLFLFVSVSFLTFCISSILYILLFPYIFMIYSFLSDYLFPFIVIPNFLWKMYAWFGWSVLALYPILFFYSITQILTLSIFCLTYNKTRETFILASIFSGLICHIIIILILYFIMPHP